MAVLKRKCRRALFSCSLPVMAVLACVVLPGVARAAGDDIKVGVAAAVNQDAQSKPPHRPVRRLYLGNDLVFNEMVRTGPRGLTQILLSDRSALTVGSNSTLVIDKFVYDPNVDKGALALSLAKGAVRFVGGALSKKRGQVMLKTPSATIGIRGAVVLVQVLPDGVRFIMSFGREVVVSGPDGTRQRITAPGYAVFVPFGGSPQQPEPVTDEEISLIQARLAGRLDANGGSDNPPSGDQIDGSDIARRGSGDIAIDLGTDVPPPPDDDGGGQVTEDNQRNGVTGAGAISSGRLQLSGTNYLIGGTGSILPSGTTTDAAGLLGGTTDAGAEQILSNITFSATALTASLSGGGSITLPFTATGTGVSVTPSNSASPFGDLSGTGIFFRDSAGNLEFAYYDLRESSDVLPAFLMFGTPLGASGQVAVPEVKSFALLSDSVQFADYANTLPFVAGQAFSGATLSSGGFSSPLYYIEQNDGTVGTIASDGSVSAFLQASLYLEGTGSTQKSSLAVIQGEMTRESGFSTPIAETNRRGGGRIGNTDTFVYDGVVRTLDDGGGSTVFGNETNYFVLSNDTRNNGAFSDLGFPGGGLTTGMRHVAVEGSTTEALSSLTRSAVTLNGYAAGLIEGFNFTGAYPVNSRAADGSSVSLSFDPAKNRLAAVFRLGDNLSLSGTSSGGGVTVSNYDLYFGNGRSTYIDDDRYAARGDTLNDSTVDGTVVSAAASGSLSDSGKLYLLASTVAPINPASTAIPSGVSLCSACNFIEWGWWGAMPTYQSGSNSGRQELVHMGSWVAGDIPTVAELPVTGTASYSGHAIGTVDAGSSRYVAIGSFSMSYDFAQGSGSVTINSFDGQNLSSSPTGTTLSSGPASFSGSITSSISGRSGSLGGAFVRGPNSVIDGAIGDFNLSDGGSYSASGVFLGAKSTGGGGSL